MGQKKVEFLSNYFITYYFCAVRLMPGSCQAPFPVLNNILCPAYCSSQPECQALMPSWLLLILCCVMQVLVRLSIALSSSALVRLMWGPCLVQMSGYIQALVQLDISPTLDISLVSNPLVIINYESGSNV